MPSVEAPVAATGKKSIASLLARGSTWALVGYAVSQAFRLASNLILWKLLEPKVFGLMAIVSAVTMGLAMFSDIGIGPSIVQHARGDDPTYLNTAWTIQTFRGTVLCAFAVLVAWPVARFYAEPQLGPLLAVSAFQMFFAGFNSTRLFTASRHMSLGRVTLIDLCAQLLQLLSMIALAAITHSIWSIVWGGFASTLLKLLLSHLALPGIENRFRFDRPSVRELVSFGRWVFFSTLLTFGAMQSDRLIFGKLMTIEQLGVYNISNVWASIPLAVVGRVFDSALFPALCRLNAEKVDFQRSLRELRTPWLMLSGAMCTCLVAGGPALIRFMYDQRAADAEWIVQILAASMWLFTLENANGTALLARGFPKFVAAGNLAKLLAMIVLIPLGMKLHGFVGAIVGYAISEVFRYFTSVVTLAFIKITALRDDAWLTLLALVIAGGGILLSRWMHLQLLPLAAHWPRAAAGVEAVAVGGMVSLGWTLVFLRHRRTASTRLAASA